MAKSLLNQFTQTRGSRTYDDTMTMAWAEITGRSLSAGQTATFNGTAVTIWTGTALTDGNVGDYIVVGGTAYVITVVADSATCTLGSATPYSGSSESCALHSRQNLEDDLNYIRTQLELVVGENNWYDEPNTSLSGIKNTVDNLTSTFAELTDTYGFDTYTADQMLYTSSSGVHGTSDMTYDPDTGDIQIGATGGARVALDADSKATVYGDDDTYLLVSGTGSSYVDNGTLRMSITDEGLSLESGARVNDIVTSITADDDTHLVTEGAIKTYVDTAVSGSNEFTELTDTPSDYTGDQYKLVNVNAGETALQFTDMTYDGTTLEVPANINSTGNVTVTGTLDVDGAVDLDSTLNVEGVVTFQNNLTVNETFGFNTGTTVTEIATSVDGTGDDDTLLTEAAIWSLVNTVSGAMVHNELEGLQGGTVNEYYHLTNNEDSAFSSDGVTFTFTQALAGTDLDLSGDLTAVSGSFSGNVSVDGTFGFDAGTTVNEIVTSIDVHGPGSDDQLATEKSIFDFVNTVSGVLQTNMDGQDEFIELSDTPAAYAGASNQLLRVNSTPDAVVFESELTYDGSELNVGGDINVTGDASFDTNVAISGTFGFDTGTTVNEIQTSLTAPGDDNTLLTEAAIYNWVNTVSGSLQSDVIWEIVDTPTTQIRPKVEHLSKAIYTEGNVTIGGNLTVTGTLFYADTETVQVTDNIMHINYGEVGPGVTAGEAGIQVERGSEIDYFFIFDEGTDTFRIGVSGTQNSFNVTTLQPVATREDSPTDTRVAWWDADDYTFRTQGDTFITVNSGTDTLGFTVDSTEEMNITTAGMSLKSGADVNEILDSGDTIDVSSTDDQLATAKLIYTTYSGLAGLQGGTPTYMYYVDNDGNAAETEHMTFDAAAAEVSIGDPSVGRFYTNESTFFGGALGPVSRLQAGGTGGLTTSSGLVAIGDDTATNSLIMAWNADGTAMVTEDLFAVNFGNTTSQLTVYEDRIHMGFDDTDGTAQIRLNESAETIILEADSSVTIEANSVTEMTIDTGGMKLKNSTADVNEILNTVDGDSISAASTDDQLTTAKLIYNTISGAGMIDGTPDQMFYVDNSGDMKATSNMTYDADGTTNVLALTDASQRLGVNNDTYLILNSTDNSVYLLNGNEYTLYADDDLTFFGRDDGNHHGMYWTHTNGYGADPTTADFYLVADDYSILEYTSSDNTLSVGQINSMDIDEDGNTFTFLVNNDAEMIITVSGVALRYSSVYVNEILNTVDGDSIDASSTDAQLATAKLIYNEISTLSGTVSALTYLDLTDTPSSYPGANYFALSNGAGNGMTFASTVAHNTYLDNLDGGTSGQYYHLTSEEYGGFSTSGGDTWNSNYNFTMSPGTTFSVASGTSVNDIDTVISAPGDDDSLATTKAIVDYVTTVTEAQDTFIELTDTPANYTSSNNYYLRVNDAGDAVVFDNTINDWMADSEEPTGFTEYKVGSTIAVSGTSTITISGTYSYWIKGTKYEKDGVDSVALSDTEGIQFIYFDGETLTATDTFTNDILSDYAYVANAYWDTDANAVLLLGDERHGMIMDSATHINLHNSQGTVYISGMSPGSVTVDGDGSLDSHAHFAMGSGAMLDEDIRHSISAVASGTGLPVFYKDGSSAVWRRDTSEVSNGFSFLTGTTYPEYNQFTGGAWTTTELTSGQLVLVHVFATNDADQSYIAIAGENVYADNTAAREGAATEINDLALNGLPSAEFVAVATFILEANASYTNTWQSRFISTDTGDDFVDWRFTNLTGGAGGSSANDHSQLTGLTDPSVHPASSIYTSTTNFDGALSSADDTVQKALDTLDNALDTYAHAHYEKDLTLSGSNVWTVTDADITGLSTSDMDVYLNGLLNRDNDGEYFTASVDGNKLTVTFAYNTYSNDWAHVKFFKDEIA